MREILAVEIADTENKTTWSDLFKKLKTCWTKTF
ncbi:MAG: transposase [Planctomycetes bacterium]|nr:transposase [Planctomycetota bacterium]